MPVHPQLTPRQLRTIADRVEQLTKARLNNAAMGVPTTPDRFECRFPSGHRGTVVWSEAPLTSAKARDRAAGQPVFRYVVVLHAPQQAELREVPLEDTEAAVGEAIAKDAERRGGPGMIVDLPSVPDETLARIARVQNSALK